ncbi:MAG: hypothetical protein AB7E47_09880 [Desulfovibrionaceae bacterium]
MRALWGAQPDGNGGAAPAATAGRGNAGRGAGVAGLMGAGLPFDHAAHRRGLQERGAKSAWAYFPEQGAYSLLDRRQEGDRGAFPGLEGKWFAAEMPADWQPLADKGVSGGKGSRQRDLLYRPDQDAGRAVLLPHRPGKDDGAAYRLLGEGEEDKPRPGGGGSGDGPDDGPDDGAEGGSGDGSERGGAGGAKGGVDGGEEDGKTNPDAPAWPDMWDGKVPEGGKVYTLEPAFSGPFTPPAPEQVGPEGTRYLGRDKDGKAIYWEPWTMKGWAKDKLRDIRGLFPPDNPPGPMSGGDRW